MKKIIMGLISFLTALIVVTCYAKNTNAITVGTIDGPDVKMLEVAKKVAEQRYGLHIKIIAFSDYNIPNGALNDGSIDANVFQHIPFLEAQIKNRGYKLSVIGKTFIFPMGIYSKKIKDISRTPVGASIAIPNDPSNEARALLLLQNAKLIKLKSDAGINATVRDIVENPKHLRIVELEAPQLPRSLDDVTLSVINNNFAVAGGLSPVKDAIFLENPDSPYANVIVVRTKDINDPRLKQLVEAMHSEEVKNEAKKLFGENAIPAGNSR